MVNFLQFSSNLKMSSANSNESKICWERVKNSTLHYWRSNAGNRYFSFPQCFLPRQTITFESNQYFFKKRTILAPPSLHLSYSNTKKDNQLALTNFLLVWTSRQVDSLDPVYIEDICFFRWKIKIYFIEWTPSVIFSRVAQKILVMVFTRWNKFESFTEKHIFCLFHAFNPVWEKLYQNPVQFFSVMPCGVPLPHSNALQYYIKRKKFKVNDIIFHLVVRHAQLTLAKRTWKSVFWCYQCKIEKCFHRYFSISYWKVCNNFFLSNVTGYIEVYINVVW